MDGDGDNDLIIGTRWGYVAYYERLGNGTLAAADTLFDLPGDNSQPLVIDYDNDGDLDLLVYGHGADDMPIFLFRSNGDLQNSVDPQNYDSVVAPVMHEKDKYPTIAMSDLDGDGLQDLIIAVGAYDINLKNAFIRIRWYKNSGTVNDPYFNEFEYLNFAGADSVDDAAETYKVPYITTTDYNNDGIPDILLGASQQKLAVPEEQLVVWYGERDNTSKKILSNASNHNKILFDGKNVRLNVTDSFKISILDMKGKTLFEEECGRKEIDLSTIAANGVYLVNMRIRNCLIKKRVVINPL